LILRILRRLAQVDSSLAHLFGFQHLQVASVLLFGSEAQQARFLGQAVEHRWFWGNAVNARDNRLSAVRTPGGLEIDGVKAFCSGATDSDVLNVSVVLGPEPTDRVFAVVPTSRAGIRVHGDWDNMGQRQTDSGNVSFDHVRIADDEVLGPPGVASSPRATLRNLIGQVVLTEIYLGNALGALREAIGYLRTQTQPWPMAGVERSQDDRLLQLRAGEMWSALQAAVALANHANAHFQQAWDRGGALTAEQRAALAIDVASARTQAARTALHVTAQIFELVGARATASRHGFIPCTTRSTTATRASVRGCWRGTCRIRSATAEGGAAVAAPLAGPRCRACQPGGTRADQPRPSAFCNDTKSVVRPALASDRFCSAEICWRSVSSRSIRLAVPAAFFWRMSSADWSAEALARAMVATVMRRLR
jgi:alkylation response protein AidB-like acyl-CoA dehydrogenase